MGCKEGIRQEEEEKTGCMYVMHIPYARRWMDRSYAAMDRWMGFSRHQRWIGAWIDPIGDRDVGIDSSTQ
jgi:hypothetical protein